MEWPLRDYFTASNFFLALLLFLVFNQLIELYQFRNMPPGPHMKSLPFLGNILSFDSTEPGERLFNATKSIRKNYGTVYSFKVGAFKVVVADDAESVKEVLVKRSADFAGRPPFHTFVLFTRGGKDVILGNYGPAWRFYRKVFVSATRRYLSDQQLIEERICEQAGRLLTYFENQNGKDFNPSGIIPECVANVICRITFGKHFDSSHPEFHELLHQHETLINDAALRSVTFLLDFFPIAKYLPLEVYRVVKRVSDRIFMILRKRLKEYEVDFDPSAEIENLTAALLKERIVALGEIANEDKADLLSDDYLLNTMEDMFLAGFETTSTTLRWIIAFLVNNPEYQQEIQDQLDDVVGRNRMPGLGDRPNLPLVQATIMEALRIGNILEAAVPHYTLKDTILAGYRVPKDTVVIANLQSVHEDPDCWENPLTFDPHRHIDPSSQLVTNSGNFLPFSAGRRSCAGEPLAKVELFCFLSWMLHKFTFMPPEGGTLPDLHGISGFTRFPAPYKIRAFKRE